MNIDKDTLTADLQQSIDRYKTVTQDNQSDYDYGFLMGLHFAQKIINLQPPSGIGQIAFEFGDENDSKRIS